MYCFSKKINTKTNNYITTNADEILEYVKKHSEGYPEEDDAGYDQLGFYYGFSLFVLENPEIDGIGATKGIYGWSGYHNTHFWIDPEKKLYGLFMSRAREFDFGIQKRFRKEVYSAIN